MVSSPTKQIGKALKPQKCVQGQRRVGWEGWSKVIDVLVQKEVSQRKVIDKKRFIARKMGKGVLLRELNGATVL